MCSNRWANPERPGSSLALPTSYQMFTATTGVEWSSCTITVIPLESVKLSNSMGGALPCPNSGAANETVSNKLPR